MNGVPIILSSARKSNFRNNRKASLAFASLILFPATSTFCQEKLPPQALWKQTVVEIRGRLASDGASAFQLKLFDQVSPQYVEAAMLNKMLDKFKPSSSEYENYDLPRYIRKVNAFMEEHWCAFKQADTKYKVEPSIVASILWIETLYGTYTPKQVYPTFSSLVSIAALSSSDFREAALPTVLEESKKLKDIPENFDWVDRAKNVVGEAWYKQVKAYLQLAQKYGWDSAHVANMKGSWAGAIGGAQSMPLTLLDRIQNDSIPPDLHEWDDVILITARHLESKGWKNDGTDEAQYEAVHRYNNSKAYAKAALRVRGKILEKQKALYASNPDCSK